MKIKKLTLNNFMAFENAEINWSDNINIICGENSTGKTTLLKVMYSLNVYIVKCKCGYKRLSSQCT